MIKHLLALGLILVSGLNVLWASDNRPGGDVVVGRPGPAGPAGSDASVPKLTAGIGLNAIVKETQSVIYSIDYRRDFIRPSDAVFGMIGARIGPSPQDKKITALQAEIESMKRALKNSPSSKKVPVYGNN